MKEFAVRGSIFFEGVTFYVKADSMEGALARLCQGDFDSYDTDRAHTVDHRVALASIEENP